MSKSGSKALSKSVDSVVKSVESVVTSVLPKNMNMKHVLLAILVGLLLCMLMGNTVEGFGGDTATPSEGYCFNEKNRTGDTQRCKAKVGAAEFICPDKTSPSANTATGVCGGITVVAGGDAPVKLDDFCRQFSNNIGNQLNNPGTSCNTGDGGHGDVCEYGVATSETTCGGVSQDMCPGGDGTDARPVGISDEINDNCSWEDCSDFPTSQTVVNEVFNSPLKREPLKKWASCVENNPGTQWRSIKTKSQRNALPWSVADPTGKWVAGTSTGKPYSSGSTITNDDLAILKPLIYKNDGVEYTAFSDSGLDDATILPNNTWRVAIDNKIIECGTPLTPKDATPITRGQALDAGAIVGWNHSKSGLVCLNENPAIEKITTEKRKYLVKAPGCGITTDPAYCSPDGLLCGVDQIKPTESQRKQHTTTCKLNAVEAGINTINDNIVDLQDTVKSNTAAGIRATTDTVLKILE